MDYPQKIKICQREEQQDNLIGKTSKELKPKRIKRKI